jgi:hypothetical protein
MICPSTKTLEKSLNITAEQARLIRKFAKAADDRDALQDLVESNVVPHTAQYVNSLHSSPYNSYMWRVTVALHAMDNILETHGVEGMWPANDRECYAPPYEYLNTGDTYDLTLIYKRETDRLFLGSWGCIAERHSDWE